MATEMTKPRAPITKRPIAETLEIVLNSVMLGSPENLRFSFLDHFIACGEERDY